MRRDTKDYEINIKVKNGPLMRAIYDAGYENVNQFCAGTGLRPTEVGKYVGLKKSPILKDGTWSVSVLRLADALQALPEDLFPEQHLHDPLVTNEAKVEMSAWELQELGLLSAPKTMEELENDIASRQACDNLLSHLPERTERIMRLRLMEGATLDQIATEEDVTRERIRHIYEKGIRTLRHRAAADGITAETCGI